MNKDQVIGNWEQFKGSVKEKWGKLTDDQIAEVNGNRQQLAGKIQEAYGIAKEEAEDQINSWEEECRHRNVA
ncbi:MAG: CsbD family protein [Rickettsiales bacterium]